MRIHLNKTARREELFTYKILGKKIFKNRNVKIGDNSNEHCPDIYSFDKIIGVEVVTCETYRIYKSKRASKLGNMCRAYSRFHNKKPQKFINVETERNEYYNNFQSTIISKLENLNDDFYSGVKQINLVVLSNLSTKNYINEYKLQDIIINCNSKFNKSFEKIFVVFQNKTIYFNKNGEIVNE